MADSLRVVRGKTFGQWVVVVSLTLVAFAELWQVARQPYLIDIIGRSLRIAAAESAKGHPIYSAPALAMSYTPGYILLNAAAFRLWGFSYGLWNAIWATSGIAFLLIFSIRLWRIDKAFAPFVPAGLLACLFPFVWARGDIYAILLVGIGMFLIDPLSANATRGRLAASVAIFGLALFFKQTMLPVIAAIVILSGRDHLLTKSHLLRSAGILALVAIAFTVLMATYIAAWGEDLAAVVSVLTLGKHHTIHIQQLLRYFAFYSAILVFPALYIFRHSRWAMTQMLILVVLGLPYVVFSAKEGGAWHHFLVLLMPWIWFLVKARRDARSSGAASSDGVLWVGASH